MRGRVIGGRRVGKLEAEVLQELWRAGGAVTGRELVERLPGRSLAYTTVMTVLGRLLDKGLVERALDGRTYRYRAAGDADALTARTIAQLLASARDRRAVLAHLVEDLDDPDLAAELAAILDRTQTR
jgi:predicted transcriptional regulator